LRQGANSLVLLAPMLVAVAVRNPGAPAVDICAINLIVPFAPLSASKLPT